MAKKYYAVAVGKSGLPMILESWDSCKAEVIGCKGAIYKSFPTKEEAVEFISLHQGNSQGTATKKVESNMQVEVPKGIAVYVDGSFMVDKGNYSYGLVVIKDDEVLYEDCGIGYDEEAISLRNVSGEVLGAMKAVEYSLIQGYDEITICFDYQGVESWALGTWKRNNRITQGYHEFMKDKMKKIKINFKKIKGHSGDKYNDMADRLAKRALENVK
jgi:ribonuclease HI